MHVAVKKWGNSASIRIPSSIMKAVQLHIDEMVEIREDNGRIVIEPVRSAGYNLQELLAGITKDNRHGEMSFGAAVGKELL